MKPIIVEITEKIGEKQVTLFAVRPLIYKLLTKYLQVTSEDSRVKRKLRRQIKQI